MATTTYGVNGMTCEHCVHAVTQELSKLDGVQKVQVSLENGTATVDSAQPLEEQDVRAAIDEAGYELTGVLG